MSTFTYVGVAGAGLLAIGLIVGFFYPVNGSGSLCGSFFAPSDAAAYFDALAGPFSGREAECAAARGRLAVPVWGAIGLGVVTILAATLAAAARSRN